MSVDQVDLNEGYKGPVLRVAFDNAAAASRWAERWLAKFPVKTDPLKRPPDGPMIFEPLGPRDEIAVQAMLGLIARSPMGELPKPESIAKMAYRFAGAMLAERRRA